MSLCHDAKGDGCDVINQICARKLVVISLELAFEQASTVHLKVSCDGMQILVCISLETKTKNKQTDYSLLTVIQVDV